MAQRAAVPLTATLSIVAFKSAPNTGPLSPPAPATARPPASPKTTGEARSLSAGLPTGSSSTRRHSFAAARRGVVGGVDLTVPSSTLPCRPPRAPGCVVTAAKLR